MSLAHPFNLLSRKAAFFILVLSSLMLLLVAILSLLVPAAHAAQVTVAWDANTDPAVTGYRSALRDCAGELHLARRCGERNELRDLGALGRGYVLFLRHGLRRRAAMKATTPQRSITRHPWPRHPILPRSVSESGTNPVRGGGSQWGRGLLHRHGRLRQLPGAGGCPPAEVPGPHTPDQ